MSLKTFSSTNLAFTCFIALFTLVFLTKACPVSNCTCTISVIDCRNLKLLKIPDGIPNTTVVLMLSGNEIDTLPSSAFFGLKSLRTLLLANNKIAHIDNLAFEGLKNLRKLELQGNKLTSLPFQVFDDVTSLEDLNIGNNRIQKLMTGNFYKLRKLINLTLSNNRLETFSKNYLFNLNSILNLDLKLNKIASIDDYCFQNCKSISQIDLSGNYLSAINENMLNAKSGFISLKILNLRNNTIGTIHKHAFNKLSKLKYLDISKNNLVFDSDNLGGIFEHVPLLETLKLNDNKIKFIGNEAFSGLSSLVNLNLSGNPIQTIEKGSFGESLGLQKINIATTSLICDCRIVWLLLRPYDRIILQNSQLVCRNPNNLRGRNIGKLSNKDFTCDKSQRIPIILTEPPAQAIAVKGEQIPIMVGFRIVGQLSAYQWFWVKNSSRLSSDNQIILSKMPNNHCRNDTDTDSLKDFTAQLTLKPLNHDITGLYFFVITNKFGKSISSAKTRVIFAEYPKFESTFTDLTYRIGEDAVLNCRASGFPNPNITFTKNGNISVSLSHRLKFTVQGIRIVNVSVADMGEYTCTAENIVGSISQSLRLSVLMNPIFTKPAPKYMANVLVNEAIILECFVAGSPFPKISWLRNGTVITRDRAAYYDRGQTLIIRSATPDDNGEYLCRATNAIGSVKRTTRVTIFLPNGFSLPGSERNPYLTIIITACTCVFGTSLLWVFILSYRVRLLRKEIETSKSSTFLPLHSYTIGNGSISKHNFETAAGKTNYSERHCITAAGYHIASENSDDTIEIIDYASQGVPGSNLHDITRNSTDSDIIIPEQSMSGPEPWIASRPRKSVEDRVYSQMPANSQFRDIVRAKPLQVVTIYDKISLSEHSTDNKNDIDQGNSKDNMHVFTKSKESLKESDDECQENSMQSSLTDLSQKSLTESRLHAGSLTESALARCSENGSNSVGKLKIIQNLITEVVDGIPSTEV
ncbi:Leucine-rich repeats and immunoglobulin-like domains protein 3 [Trichoplax sp. H2]|nr:Leucine-rich repeats and immunoglobulin-like domains protein 3 [Trichoplax sp. H2]|eukprot:RDD47210.1 Leucine-rich repeats and immunoglobulin-like domains protein 3 [Trichoplax sp. H2]